MLYSRLSQVISFTHSVFIYVNPASQFIPLLLSPLLGSIRLPSTSVSLFPLCKQAHLYHFSRVHMYALIQDMNTLLILINTLLILTTRVAQRIPPTVHEPWRHRLTPWVGQIPGRRARQSTPVILPGESPRTEEPGGLQSMGSQRDRHN